VPSRAVKPALPAAPRRAAPRATHPHAVALAQRRVARLARLRQQVAALARVARAGQAGGRVAQQLARRVRARRVAAVPRGVGAEAAAAAAEDDAQLLRVRRRRASGRRSRRAGVRVSTGRRRHSQHVVVLHGCARGEATGRGASCGAARRAIAGGAPAAARVSEGTAARRAKGFRSASQALAAAPNHGGSPQSTI
jgi:hypothetical protein